MSLIFELPAQICQNNLLFYLFIVKILQISSGEKKEKEKKKQISAILTEDNQVKFNHCTFHLELARWTWASGNLLARGFERGSYDSSEKQ